MTTKYIEIYKPDRFDSSFPNLITTTHLGSFNAQWINALQILEVKAGQLVEQEIF